MTKEIKNIFAEENFANLSLTEIYTYYETYDFAGSMIKADFTRKKTNLIHHNPFEVIVEQHQELIDNIFKEHNDIDGLLVDMEESVDNDVNGRVAWLPRKVKTKDGTKVIILTATPDIIKWNKFMRRLEKLRVRYSMFSGSFQYIVIEDFELNRPVKYTVEKVGENGAGQEITLEQFSNETGKSLNYNQFKVIKRIPAVIFTNYKCNGVDSRPSLDREISGVNLVLKLLNLLHASLMYEAVNGHSKVFAGGMVGQQYKNLINQQMGGGKHIETVSELTGINLENSIMKPATFDSGIFYGIIDKLERWVYEIMGFAKDIANDSGAQKNDLEHKYNRRSLITNLENMVQSRRRRMKELIQLIVLMETGKDIKLESIKPNFKEQPLQSLAEISDFASKTGLPVKVSDTFLLEQMGLSKEDAMKQIEEYKKTYGDKLAPMNNQTDPKQEEAKPNPKDNTKK